MSSKTNHKILLTIFLAVFLDVVGFSILFPLFPEILNHYIQIKDSDAFFALLLNSMDFVSIQTSFSTVVLFGAIMGGSYSLMQFIFAPIWGQLSDRFGRKPILLICMTGIALSSVIWIFAGNFTLFVISRILAGIMAGSISTATAVISDITDVKNRTKSMALIGIALALGFIAGPALGGFLSYFQLSWDISGINPFSVIALAALILSLVDVFLIAWALPETNKNKTPQTTRSNNPFLLFSHFENPKLAIVNWTYFLYISIFAGMEFTLAFVTVERLDYKPTNIAWLFVYVGLMAAFFQGGFVRRFGHKIGEAKLAAFGLAFLIPGLLILAYAQTNLTVYLSLGFLSLGASCAFPCLTSLVSFYSSESTQGKNLGVFRSLGALGRAFGPAFAGLLYWKLYSENTYLILAAMVLLPLALFSKALLSSNRETLRT